MHDSHDLVGTSATPLDPKLNALADNGGKTQTMALQSDSPAVDRGNNDASIMSDQRGFERRVDQPDIPNAGDASDIGAYELGTPSPTPTPTPTATPTPTPTPNTLVNIATRMQVLGGDNALIDGFIVTGNQSKKLIIRGIGPSLSNAGVQGALADPVLELHQGNSLLTSNDNWKDTQAADIQASGVAPSNDLEAAIVATLPPGAYTAILRGKNDATGIGLVEVYELDTSVDSKLANISTRGFVDTGDNVMIGGLIVGGDAAAGGAKVIVRAIGPSLQNSGVANALQDPILELHDGNGGIIQVNDNWKTTQQTEIEQSGVAPANDAESAIVATLAPGHYTAIVRGVDNTTGVGLVEVYNLR